jgi:hypothetical protein
MNHDQRHLAAVAYLRAQAAQDPQTMRLIENENDLRLLLHDVAAIATAIARFAGYDPLEEFDRQVELLAAEGVS